MHKGIVCPFAGGEQYAENRTTGRTWYEFLRITVFRKTLEALEWPSHYRFLYNRKMKQIAVQACGAEEAGAHRVGKLDESNSGEIKCMALVRMIYGDSGWDKKMSYRLLGRAFPQQRLVSFKITDAMQIENGRVLTEM